MRSVRRSSRPPAPSSSRAGGAAPRSPECPRAKRSSWRGFGIEAVPALHPGDHCVGYVIAAGPYRLYHSGDTAAIDPGVRGVDVAFVPINGRLGNTDGPEAARLAQTVGAALAVPCHYDMFEFNTASPAAFAAECDRLGQPYRVLRNGGRLSLRE